MRAFIIGSKNLSCAILDELVIQGHEVLGVFSRDNEPGMRIWHELGHRNLANEARSLGIPVYENLRVNSKEAIQLLSGLNLDIILSCFWSEIFKEEALNIPKLGVFNFHTAYLPLNRGSRPLPWALIKGENHCGISVHKMLTGIDNGPIVSQTRVEITDQDTGLSLYNKVNQAGVELARSVIEQFANNSYRLTPQNEEVATYQPRGEPFGRQLNAFWDEGKKDRFVRAFTFPPFKGALAPPKEAIKEKPGVYLMFSISAINGSDILDIPTKFFSITRTRLTVFTHQATMDGHALADLNLLGADQEHLQFSLKKDSPSRLAMLHLKASLEDNEGIKGFRPGLTNNFGLMEAYRPIDLLYGRGVQYISSKQMSDVDANKIIPMQPHRHVNGLLEIPFTTLEAQSTEAMKNQLNGFVTNAAGMVKMHQRDMYIGLSINKEQIELLLNQALLMEDLEKKGVGFLSYSEVCAHFNAIYSEEK